ncbi:MAG TPA: hypothetical protein PLU24_04995 [Candidatus Omnitrophota bacterium]|nr:hypothetical protein [Candidatus Omnitrophota bacterium]
MDLDSEQRSQSSEIAGQRARFKVLLKDVKRNRVKVGMKRNAIIGRYGVPVLEEGNTILYRDPVNFLDSEKIYLTFDDNGILKETNLEEKDGQ